MFTSIYFTLVFFTGAGAWYTIRRKTWDVETYNVLILSVGMGAWAIIFGLVLAFWPWVG